MAQRKTGKLGLASEGADSPINYAVTDRDRSTLEMVRQAVAHKEVLLAFQPVVQSRNTSAPAFYEGLIRVLDDTGRIIPAKDFMPTVENSELGRQLDCLALEKGLRALARNPGIRLSINMSARSIGFPRWLRSLERSLKQNPTIGERLILEITESSAMLVPELVINFMKGLQSKGICFALDDFGAGYTAFRHFRDFYFDIVKIDGQFIRGIADSPDNQVLVGALASIAEQFDMLTVAEHVERPEDAAMLVAMGIECLQGYYFGAPSVRPPWKNPAKGSVPAQAIA